MTTSDIKRILGTVGVETKHMFHGVYMASVVNTNDPLSEGRVTLKVPQVLGTATSNWADPLGFSPGDIPPPGTIVHAYFTGGDINLPIYVKIDLTDIKAEIATIQSQISGIIGFPTAWTSLSLQAGWSNIGSFTPAQIRTVSPGVAQIVGHIQNGTSTDSTLIATIPGYSASSTQNIAVTVMGGGSSQAFGFTGGDTDSAGLTDGTINGLSGQDGLTDGTINGNSASASGSGAHTHGAGSYAVTNGQHQHDSGSFSVANGNHTHGTTALTTITSISSLTPMITIDGGGNCILFNTTGAETQLSFNATLVV